MNSFQVISQIPSSLIDLLQRIFQKGHSPRTLSLRSDNPLRHLQNFFNTRRQLGLRLPLVAKFPPELTAASDRVMLKSLSLFGFTADVAYLVTWLWFLLAASTSFPSSAEPERGCNESSSRELFGLANKERSSRASFGLLTSGGLSPGVERIRRVPLPHQTDTHRVHMHTCI